MRRASPALGVLFAVVLTAGGCGGDPDGASGSVLDGPPLWRLAREEVEADATTLTLHVRSPMRARLRLEASGRLPELGTWRDLAAGQTLRVIWSHRTEKPGQAGDRPPAELEAAGRTEAHGLQVHYRFEDSGVMYRRIVFWTRPGRGRVVARSALPPGTYRPLPMDGSLELLTLVAADTDGGKVSLRPEGTRHRIVWRPADPELDGYEELHLYLDLASPGTPSGG